MGRRETDLLRQQHALQMRAWEEYGRVLHAVHNNEAARAQRAAIYGENRTNNEAMRVERQRLEHRRARETAALLEERRERAERARQRNALAVRAVSAAELHTRRQTGEEMRAAEARRMGVRSRERSAVISNARVSHDAVDATASVDHVADCNAAERRDCLVRGAPQE